MKTSTKELLALFSHLRSLLSGFTIEEIEFGVMLYFLEENELDSLRFRNLTTNNVALILRQNGMPAGLEEIIDFFESLIENEQKSEDGIVFTPKYISDYIADNVLKGIDTYQKSIRIIDPGCGCGVFLVSAAEFLHLNLNVDIDTVIKNNIFGIDINADNVRRCTLVLKMLSAKYGGNYNNLSTNILCRDSLRTNWSKAFDVENFQFVIGNPPYANAHKMNKKTVSFLRDTFFSTQKGTFNIFYAFIEQGMKHLDKDGILGFIIPNNFLTIKSAKDIRDYILTNKYLFQLIDFRNNMAFKPIRTYSCIIYLTRKPNSSFKYYVMPKVEDIKTGLNSVKLNIAPLNNLHKQSWNLVDEQTNQNLKRIELQQISIKDFIRTGIATLKDEIFFIEQDTFGFYKHYQGSKQYLERDLIKPIYKIPELKSQEDISDVLRHIIFPYVKTHVGYELIDENQFAQYFPITYEYLSRNREALNSREKGKSTALAWYAYGRTQGLNKFGKKLLFPTFSKKPRFILVEDEDTLFCNGYAVFENNWYELEVLEKILNSNVMEYYIKNTSYSIEGGYYCYQKKFVERFSIPWLTEEQKFVLKNSNQTDANSYLWQLYGLH